MSRFGRWGTGLLFGGLSAVAFLDSLAMGVAWYRALELPAVLVTLWVIFTIRPAICLDDHEVVVRNPLWTRRIPLRSIAEAKPGYFGIILKRHGRKLAVTAWAVQETNTAAALDADTRAKQVAAQIMAAVSER